MLAGGCAPLPEHPTHPIGRAALAEVGPASPRLRGPAAHAGGLHEQDG